MNRNELLQVQGGGWLLIAGVVAGAITFVIGVIDGFIRPLSCHD